jgi:hypothetical protein
MASRKPPSLTLETIRMGTTGLTQEGILAASRRLLAALKRNREAVQKGRTPGTTATEQKGTP